MDKATQQSEVKHQDSIGSFRLWFGVLGGAVSWLVHLMGAYAISEFGCVSEVGRQSFLGISLVAWQVFVLTALTALVAAVAALAAYRNLLAAGPLTGIRADASVATARLGLISSGLFLLVILVETVPILYYLRSC